MNISSNFNSFYHSAVLTELYRKCGTLKFSLWIDDETGGVFEFIKGEHFNDMDDLKQILKNMNVDYEIDDSHGANTPLDYMEKLSTSKIDSKSLMQHIEFVINLAGENHIEFGFIQDEWDRLLNQAHNYERK